MGCDSIKNIKCLFVCKHRVSIRIFKCDDQKFRRIQTSNADPLFSCSSSLQISEPDEQICFIFRCNAHSGSGFIERMSR